MQQRISLSGNTPKWYKITCKTYKSSTVSTTLSITLGCQCQVLHERLSRPGFPIIFISYVTIFLIIQKFQISTCVPLIRRFSFLFVAQHTSETVFFYFTRNIQRTSKYVGDLSLILAAPCSYCIICTFRSQIRKPKQQLDNMKIYVYSFETPKTFITVRHRK